MFPSHLGLSSTPKFVEKLFYFLTATNDTKRSTKPFPGRPVCLNAQETQHTGCNICSTIPLVLSGLVWRLSRPREKVADGIRNYRRATPRVVCILLLLLSMCVCATRPCAPFKSSLMSFYVLFSCSLLRSLQIVRHGDGRRC